MIDVVVRLKQELESRTANRELIGDALAEITELRARRDALEEILIVLARMTPPWDADGMPDASFPAFQQRYRRAMHEASELLGLELRSMINRTEPRT